MDIGETICAYKLLAGKSEGKWRLRRTRFKWDINNMGDQKKTGYESVD
jgi:hypothetical protein